MAEVLRLHRDVPETWEEVLKLFIFWKQVEGRAPRTLKDYADHVTRFVAPTFRTIKILHSKRC